MIIKDEPGEEEKGIEDTKEDATDKMQEEVSEGEKESGNVADQEEVEQPVDESAETNGKRLIICDEVLILFLKNVFKL